jgi:thiosulfate reductase cytochrome b subunit
MLRINWLIARGSCFSTELHSGFHNFRTLLVNDCGDHLGDWTDSTEVNVTRFRRHPLTRLSWFFIFIGLGLAHATEPGLLSTGVKKPVVANSECLECHEAEFKPRKKGQAPEWIGLRPELYTKSVHGALACVDCHDSLTQAEHASTLPPAQCATCHEKAVGSFATSIHGTPRSDGRPAAGNCTTCHGGSHDMLPVKNLDSPVSKFSLPQTCAACHENEVAAAKLGLKNTGAVTRFRDSIHGQALYKMGLTVAPSCSDCHGVHDIKATKDATAHTSKASLTATCAVCHAGVEKTFRTSVHGELWAKTGRKSPVCTDCHTAHSIERPSNAHFKRTSDQTCGKCHEERLANYRETYHGKAMALGLTTAAPEVAACYDCHGHHDVFGHQDARSKLATGHIVATCAQCHVGVNAAFTLYQPHADPRDAKNYPGLHRAYIFMTALLVSVFAFFGLHTLLWITRFVIVYVRDPASCRAARLAIQADAETYRRFNPFERFLHMLVVTSFLLLVITGMPLKFYYTPWAHTLFRVLGGPEAARVLHHFGAIVTFLYFALHLASIARKIWRARRSLRNEATGGIELGLLWSAVFGPDSMVPSWQDARDFWAHLKWFVGKGPKPQWDRWTYWERFDYFSVFWGVAIIGLSGLVLWFPAMFTRFLPGWMINIAVVIHSDEALLAAGFIFTFHFFNTHFRLDKFPMDTVIFSGHISRSELLHERRRWYDRLVASGKLAEHQVLHSDWESRKTLYKTCGFIFLGIGVSLLCLMIYAVLSRLGK